MRTLATIWCWLWVPLLVLLWLAVVLVLFIARGLGFARDFAQNNPL